MPPQIKQDLNRSGWETTDFPSVCENCLPENNYVQMLKSDHDAVSYLNLANSRLPQELSLRGPLSKWFPSIEAFTDTIITIGMQNLHKTLHRLPLEDRPHGSPKANKHLSHLRAPEELLPMLHA